MSAQQQRVLLFMISKIKPKDDPKTMYQISISDFCKVCGITYCGKNYEAVKAALKDIADRSIWIKQPEQKKEILLRWLSDIEISEGSGTIEYTFHKHMFPYLFDLKKQYTQYCIEYVLPMRSKYAIRLYELLKSLENMKQEIVFSIEDLRKKLDAENYARFSDFRRYVLESAVNEINTYTDIKVRYEASKEGKAYKQIHFSVWHTFGAETDKRREARYSKLNISI
jgi:plasmid replication initiation protein